MTYIYTT